MHFVIAYGIYVPYGWKVSALRAEKSKANFSFREANFSFRDRTVVWPSVARLDSPDRGKERSPRGMESLPEIFPLEDYSLFSHRDAFFLSVAPWHNHKISKWALMDALVQTSFMDSPWGQSTTFMHVPFVEHYRSHDHVHTYYKYISILDFYGCPQFIHHLWMSPRTFLYFLPLLEHYRSRDHIK